MTKKGLTSVTNVVPDAFVHGLQTTINTINRGKEKHIERTSQKPLILFEEKKQKNDFWRTPDATISMSLACSASFAMQYL